MFEIGNIVEIVDRETYMERGRICSDDCAMVAYSGCLCRVIAYNNKGYKLEPVDDFEPDPKFHVNRISDYRWPDESLKEPDSIGDMDADVYFHVLTEK